MIKYYLGLTLCMFAMVAKAQTDVVLTVNDTNNKNKTGIKFKGAYNSWTEEAGFDDGTNGDAKAGDKIWSLKVKASDGTFEWGAVDQDGGWLTPGQANFTFTVAGTAVSGKTEILIAKVKPMHDVTFVITDLTNKETSLKLKGSMFNWATKDMYDNGTNGDATAGDHIWTLKTPVEEGNWEWGFENPCGWKLVGSNKQFTVAVGGAVTGAITYSIPALVGAPHKVTFRVNMENTIVKASGLYVAGDFQDRISNLSLCNWTKDTIKLTDANGDDIWEADVMMYGGSFNWKFFNGDGGDADGEKGNFKLNGCGNDNGIGGWNRSTDLTGFTKDTVLKPVYFDSCSSKPSLGFTKRAAGQVSYKIYPNPSKGNTTVFFRNAAVAHNVVIFAANGQEIANLNSKAGDASIQIANLKNGIYILGISDSLGNKSFSKLISE